MALFDTSLLIDWIGRSDSRLRLRADRAIARAIVDHEPLATTRFNIAGLLVGVYRASNRKAERRKVDSVLRGFAVLEFDAQCAEVFADISAELQVRGEPRGDMDLLIASIAVVYRQKIVTRNARHFRDIRGLTVEEY